ncbi:MAG: SusC/RagA family TonB-linked outer membrane protein, partial [Hymenobacter sp.]
ASFSKLFLEIERKTGYRFLFDDGLLPKGKTIDIDVKDEEVKTLLNDALNGSGLTYRISNDDLIIISAATNEKGAGDDYKATEINGRITDSSNQPVSGASIIERGTKNGTSSGLDGTFKLQVSGPEAVLVITSVGFSPREVTVGNQTTIAVTLLGETREVEQVVVIGYQTVRKRDLTGATAVVNTTNSNKITGNSVVEQLQGQVPGVTVRTSGAPGSNAAIEIRGVASFTNNNPLYVIDGMISDANSTINTNDIETVQILKDASAAAIYGSRAASGVIIITTRKGRTGPAKVFFSAKAGAQQLPRRWNLMDAARYKATTTAQYSASNLPVPAGIASSTFNTDWQDVVYKTGSDQDYNVGISGGSAAGNFLISGSYYKNEGVI